MNAPSNPQMFPPTEAQGRAERESAADPALSSTELLPEHLGDMLPIPERVGEAATSDGAKPPEIEPGWIRDHVQLIHMLAAPLRGQGTIVAAVFGEDPSRIDANTGKPGLPLKPRVVHAVVGGVKETLDGLARYVNLPHHNVYMPLAVFRPDLPSWAKGYERDVVACLGVVADFDDPDAVKWAERLPMPPNYVLETSAGRFQAFYLFDKPEPLELVKPVAERLKAYAHCDHGTSDVSHVWRVPGALNWPNAKKVAEGRSPEPQLARVVKWDNTRTSLTALDAALPSDALTVPGKPSSPAQRSTSDERQMPIPQTGSQHRAAIKGTPRIWMRSSGFWLSRRSFGRISNVR